MREWGRRTEAAARRPAATGREGARVGGGGTAPDRGRRGRAVYALLPRLPAGTVRGAMEVAHRYADAVLVRLHDPGVALPAGAERLTDEHVHANGRRIRVAGGVFERGDGPRVLLRFAGPVAPAWSATLERLGVVVHFWCPRFGACVALPATLSPNALRRALPVLAGMRPYRRDDCARPLRSVSPGAVRRAGVGRDWVDVVCFAEHDQGHVQAQASRLGAALIARSRAIAANRVGVSSSGMRAEKMPV